MAGTHAGASNPACLPAGMCGVHERSCAPLHDQCVRACGPARRGAQVGLEEGSLVCPESGRKFPVVRGIPNMLLNEDET